MNHRTQKEASRCEPSCQLTANAFAVTSCPLCSAHEVQLAPSLRVPCVRLPAHPQVCAAIWKWSINNETMITNLGDWCKNQKGSRGQSDKFYWVSRPSDYMLTHFKLFSEVLSKRLNACNCSIPHCLPDFLTIISIMQLTQHPSGMIPTVHSNDVDRTVSPILRKSRRTCYSGWAAYGQHT